MNTNRVPGLVSVVITNYNRAVFLKECLDSILKQSYTNWEIILIDDGSTDESVSIVRDWLKENQTHFPAQNSFVLHALPRNVGYAGAITTGYYLSKGEYIAVQDSDDLSLEHRFEKQVGYLQTNPGVGLIGTNYESFQSEQPDKRQIANWIKYGDDIHQVYSNGGHCVCHGTILFRGSVFDQIGGPTRRITGAEDYEFIAKCLNARIKIDNLPDVLYAYRIHSDQRSIQFYRKKGV